MDGLTQALEALVQKSDDLFGIELNEIEIVFRLLGIKEAIQYTSLLSLAQESYDRVVIFEAIFRHVVVNKWLAHDASDIPAGIPETVAKLVLMLSGVDQNLQEYTEELYNIFREQVHTPIMFMQRVICEVFSGYTFEVLEQLNYQKLVQIFIQAEQAQLERGIMEERYRFKKPEKVKAKQFLVEDVIKQDNEALQEFNKPQAEDPNNMARMQKIREVAIERAKKLEREHQRELRQRMQRQGR